MSDALCSSHLSHSSPRSPVILSMTGLGREREYLSCRWLTSCAKLTIPTSTARTYTCCYKVTVWASKCPRHIHPHPAPRPSTSVSLHLSVSASATTTASASAYKSHPQHLIDPYQAVASSSMVRSFIHSRTTRSCGSGGGGAGCSRFWFRSPNGSGEFFA